ncbi:MAG TPA: sigma-70 family RNA polymerase sigma factor [Pirellulaceae bacterium]|nr:sigma-70 family RNA polymerase sigma factor [Pirellulaceae bacterium]
MLRLQRQESLAWHQWVELYSPLVYHWCRETGLAAADAADVMQDVFLSVARNVSRYRTVPGQTFRGWMWTITRNKIRDVARRRSRQVEATGGSSAYQHLLQWAEKDESEEPTSPPEAHALLHRALDQIKPEVAPQTWEAFWRSVVAGEPTAQIAADLRLTPNSVRQAKSRVLRRLRQQLGD